MGRRVLVGVAVVVLALAVGGVLVADDDPPSVGVRATATTPTEHVGPTSSPAEPSPTIVMGDVGAITVEAAPRTGLVDGQVVTLTVGGADALPDDAIVLMCTGEVVGDDSAAAATGCAPSSVTAPDGTVGPDVVEGEQQVVVSRYLRVASAGSDPNVPGTYDCATESDGCILVLAPFRLPPTAVAVPLTFADVASTASTVVVTPDDGLADAQVVTVEASGLRPLAPHRISQCVAAADRWSCDWQAVTEATTDADGELLGAIRVSAALYPPEGRADCTVTRCVLVVESDASAVVAPPAGLAFADGVVAPVPRLELDPPGPYVDGQEVTIRGTGFPPGRDLSGDLGQCPAGVDTSTDERCSYDLDPVVVADDGTFTTTRAVSATLFTSGTCAEVGCVLGWVIPKGVTVAAVPIDVTA